MSWADDLDVEALDPLAAARRSGIVVSVKEESGVC
jgi:hypothetical protein